MMEGVHHAEALNEALVEGDDGSGEFKIIEQR
jgi:hypothetical protein